MKVITTSLGWEIQPESSDEQARLEWLIESLQDHRGQQPCTSEPDQAWKAGTWEPQRGTASGVSQ